MSRRVRIVIIGAGMAGIATAYTLKHAGFTNFTILEKGSDVGGVWHWNRYPGLTCDVPSQIYQFSFAPKPDWSHVWAAGEEIQRYHREVVDRFDLDAHLRCNTEVTEARYDSTTTSWTVTTRDGDTLTADFVICATGVLHHPFVPDIPGMDSFQGQIVHTARWQPELVTSDRRVAVIGTGSTGVQVVSALQPEARSLIHFARSPQWILWAPMWVRQSAALAEVLRRRPAWHDALYRRLLWASGILADIVTTPSWRRTLVQAYARWSLRAQIRDREVRAKLTPDYEPLCKRQVVSGTYYHAITRPNARLVTDPIQEFTRTGIRTADGTHHDVDVAVLATGFQAHNYMRPMVVVGRDGITLDDAWVKGPRAYRMTAIPGFPNLFTVLGPNSPTGSISLQYSAELTAGYIVSWLRRFENAELSEIEVTEQATDEFNSAVADALGPTVWNTGCNSWYFTDNGTIDLWPFDRATLTRMLSEPDPTHFQVR
ncbi:FAD-dependent pyridine nucleotide-disulfide oxidoreductase [Mycolicibacterium mageritense DSM 44476 = CIP 104973]|uniref:Monooxygenase n=1 Tax=Mycolicibacterium mageritense TaxID=53462 RepID=A0ABM7I598_MYCME|nr:NAD(P)/FAD-dependent oxidoreductase [Mycolicibacterium mageritense]MCC9184094.1 NAD(P)/FAD-dependent oxidoreductase [Mycolicibacterium mageritense]BBX38086.1 putative monooxygenase [Mycolicibacterium mageritense]CDO27179.1 monooxygenase [Mycolicibacterium mageritense DSM 44476 = CIP 104973]